MMVYLFCTLLMLAVGYFVVQSGYLALRLFHLMKRQETKLSPEYVEQVLKELTNTLSKSNASRDSLRVALSEYTKTVEEAKDVFVRVTDGKDGKCCKQRCECTCVSEGPVDSVACDQPVFPKPMAPKACCATFESKEAIVVSPLE